MKTLGRAFTALRALGRSERGAVAPILAISIVALLGITGTAVDLGHVMWVQRQLQASADAAALAGAQFVATDTSAAMTTAADYSGLSGKYNHVRGAESVSMVGGQPTLKCFSSVKVPACDQSKGAYNGIVVRQQAVVSMYFLRVLGIETMSPVATATASAKGGSGKALSVMIVLDTSNSMGQKDPGCSIKNATKIQCAQAGAYALLQGLNPATDKVGFMVFPGLKSSGVNKAKTCGAGTVGSGDTVKYKDVGRNGATYQVVGLNDTFVKDNDGNLDTTNPALIAAGKGGGNCKGIQETGTQGTYFADAIKAAQDALMADNNTKSQKVIVVLSDGDAAAAKDDLPSNVQDDRGRVYGLCQRAIAHAQSAAAAGAWVYSIAFDADTKGGCSSDGNKDFAPVNKKGLSACDTMKFIASDSAKFYADGSGKAGCVGTGGNSNDLVTVFKNISQSLTLPRLIPDNTV